MGRRSPSGRPAATGCRSGPWAAGEAFARNPLPCTLIVLHAEGCEEPWVLLTDTPPRHTGAALYACRHWIEQGFRGLKRGGWQWGRTRRTDPEAWPGLCSLVRVQAERNGPRGRQCSVRHCISSRPPDAAALPGLVRGHWGIENGLHRTLDMQFREDDCRMRKGHATTVMAVLRRAALNMVRTIQRKLETDMSIGLLRDRIGRQP